MPNFIIKTHQKNAVYRANQIFILNKGMNSGKPLKEPFNNSFVILFQDEQDAETVYWLAYSLWKARFWHQSLVGSVIPFLRIEDFKNDFSSKIKEMLQEQKLYKKQIQALRLLEQKEEQFHLTTRLSYEFGKRLPRQTRIYAELDSVLFLFEFYQ